MSFDYRDRDEGNNSAIWAGAAFAAVAAGALAASPQGRRAINKIMGTDDQGATETASVGLASWLKDAYAMEEAQIKTLNGVMMDFVGHEEIYETLKQHLAQTEKQKEDVRKCLEAIGEKPSKTKEIMGALAGLGPAIDMKMLADKKVKNILTMIAAEQFEVASYEALAIAAEREGKKAISNTMTRIAKEEKEMADWLAKQLPRIVKDELNAEDNTDENIIADI